MLLFKTSQVGFTVINNNSGEGHKWQNMLFALLLSAEVKQEALTSSSGPDSKSSLWLHMVAQSYHVHTVPEHVMLSVVFRHKFRGYKQARRMRGRKFPLLRIFLYLRKSNWEFPPSSLPRWVLLAPAGLPYRASSLMRQFLSVKTSAVLNSGIQLAKLSLATEITMADFPL